jgi:hypothetical protein
MIGCGPELVEFLMALDAALGARKTPHSRYRFFSIPDYRQDKGSGQAEYDPCKAQDEEGTNLLSNFTHSGLSLRDFLGWIKFSLSSRVHRRLCLLVWKGVTSSALLHKTSLCFLVLLSI